ncbi:MAG: hypothetical protein LBH11_03365 [Propionibacteriaceae bacterium]|jgi:hypothetical protein|nr:hypothetical protein [Propionibacteriaceae bacterium]
MGEIIETVDAEDAVRHHLWNTLPYSVKVCVPPSPTEWPPQSVYIERTGGGMTSLVVDEAQLTFESRAPTPAQAMQLALDVRAAIGTLQRMHMLGNIPIYGGTEVAAPYHDPDPDNAKLPRVTQTHTLRMRIKKRED